MFDPQPGQAGACSKRPTAQALWGGNHRLRRDPVVGAPVEGPARCRRCANALGSKEVDGLLSILEMTCEPKERRR